MSEKGAPGIHSGLVWFSGNESVDLILGFPRDCQSHDGFHDSLHRLPPACLRLTQATTVHTCPVPSCEICWKIQARLVCMLGPWPIPGSAPAGGSAKMEHGSKLQIEVGYRDYPSCHYLEGLLEVHMLMLLWEFHQIYPSACRITWTNHSSISIRTNMSQKSENID